MFDDFFGKDKDGNQPKDEHMGVNKLMKEIEAYAKIVLPSNDGVLGGGTTHLCFVAMKKGIPKLPKSFTSVPIVVTPKDSRPKEEIINNVIENKKINQRL